MLADQLPPRNAACVDKATGLLDMGLHHQVRGTPLVIFPDGSRLKGFVDATALEQKLDAMQSKS